MIAHEFSHLLNGDMRLNLKLMGILHGILVIGLLGYWILRTGAYSSGSRDKKGGGGAILLFGLALLVIGFVGMFFGKLIKSGVSRQREFLADASAVQFTRNPDGIAGALKKIGGLAAGSKLSNPNAEQASHMFFGEGVSKSWVSWLDTHPPLVDRIRRIDPSFDGEFPKVAAPHAAAAKTKPGAAASAGLGGRGGPAGHVPLGLPVQIPGLGTLTGPAGAAGGAVVLAGLAGGAAEAAEPSTAASARKLDPEKVASSVGSPTAGHLAYIASLMDALPPELARDARDPSTARAVVAALLLDPDPEIRRRQFALAAGDPVLAGRIAELAAAADRCPRAARLSLVDLAVPALRRLSPSQYRAFRELVEGLVAADRKVSLFELTLRYVLLRHLDPSFGAPPATAVQYYSLGSLGREVSLLLSALAWAGAADGEGDDVAAGADAAAAASAFAAAVRQLPDLGGQLTLLPAERCGPDPVDAGLVKLAATAAPLRRQLLQAATAAIATDGRVTLAEGELLRAVADALDLPLPPLLPGETLARTAA